MPGKLEIMEAIRRGLDSLPLTLQNSGREWTKAIKTMLCELGHEFGYQVGAGGLNFGYGEWLYDVTWLEYSRGYEPGLQNQLIDAHLVAECEFGKPTAIKDDFEKLLLARATVRLMIYDGNYDSGSEAIAERLAGYISDFKGSYAEDTWLLAAWERHADTGAWSFKYFALELSTGDLQEPERRLSTQQLLFPLGHSDYSTCHSATAALSSG